MIWGLALAGPLFPEDGPAELEIYASPLGALGPEERDRLCAAEQIYVGVVTHQTTFRMQSSNRLNRRHRDAGTMALADIGLHVERVLVGTPGIVTTIRVPAVLHDGVRSSYSVPVPYTSGERWLIATRRQVQPSDWFPVGSFVPTFLRRHDRDAPMNADGWDAFLSACP